MSAFLFTPDNIAIETMVVVNYLVTEDRFDHPPCTLLLAISLARYLLYC